MRYDELHMYGRFIIMSVGDVHINDARSPGSDRLSAIEILGTLPFIVFRARWGPNLISELMWKHK